MTSLSAAREWVSPEYLVNCFKKTGISSESKVRSQFIDDDLFKLFNAKFNNFQDKREYPLFDFKVDEYVDADKNFLMSDTHVNTCFESRLFLQFDPFCSYY